MINILFTIAEVVVFLIALLTGIGLHKAWIIWMESKSFEDQARQIHNQSAQMLMKEHSRRTR